MNNVLTQDHFELDELLVKLTTALEEGNAAQIYERLDLFWARLAMHIRAEHLHLFPSILNACKNRQQISRRVPPPEVVANKLTALQSDHNFLCVSFKRQLRKCATI